MSKKTIIIALLAVMSMTPLYSHAYALKVGALYYNFNDTDKTASVAPYDPNFDSPDSYAVGEVTIPSTVKFGDDTYTVSYIGSSAFKGCVNLTKVVIPATVTWIGPAAFSDCSSLTDVTIPETVKSVSYDLFKNCTALESYNWPKHLANIPENCFEGCSRLSSFPIPASVKKIGSYSFKGCKALTEIEIPKTVRELGRAVFTGSGIMAPVYNEWGFFYLPPSYEGTYTIPDGIGTIAPEAFLNCTKLTAVNLPESVVFSVDSPFKGCTGLQRPIMNSKHFFALPTGFIGHYEMPDGITDIIAGACRDCKNLETITLPTTLHDIGKGAFGNCTSLTSLQLPEGITSTELYLCDGCSALETVTLPESLTEISGYSFNNCSSLKEVVIPDNVTAIGFEAFAGCSSLKKLTIGKKIDDLGSESFQGCTALMEIVAYPTIPPTCQLSPFDEYDPFIDTDYNTCVLRVDPLAVADYRHHPVWGKFINIKEIVTHDGIETVDASPATDRYNCYTLQGQKIISTTDRNAILSLPAGIYIINGKKLKI